MILYKFIFFFMKLELFLASEVMSLLFNLKHETIYFNMDDLAI